MEKIINCKTEDGKLKFLVKWKDRSEDENEWIGEELFDTVKIINEFYKNIHRKDQEEQTKSIEEDQGKI